MKVKSNESLVLRNDNNKEPQRTFYDLKALLMNGSEYSFNNLQNKKILLVNTASNCGYTGQYDELQKLYEQFKNDLEIIAFPANDFKEQEQGSDEEIMKFCKLNYGVTFPVAKKTTVVKNANQNAVFKWLSDEKMNGWNNQEPTWNFSKYLVNERGMLTHFFGPAVSPLDKEIIKEISK